MMSLNYATNKEEVLDHVPKLIVHSITQVLNIEKKIHAFISYWKYTSTEVLDMDRLNSVAIYIYS